MKEDKFQVISLWTKNEKDEKYRDQIIAIPERKIISGDKREVLKKFKKLQKDFLKEHNTGKIYLVEVIAE